MPEIEDTPKTRRERLRRLLLRSVPALIPWVGDLWKDAFDEFTDDEVDQSLARLEGYAQASEDAQRGILYEILRVRSTSTRAVKLLESLRRRERRPSLLHHLLEKDWGNARFLFAQLQSPDERRVCEGIDFEFRGNYLGLLEEWVQEVLEPDKIPFQFHMYPVMIAFPEDYESYAWRFRNPPFERVNTPALIKEARVVPDGDDFYFESGLRVELPQLPTLSGFIHSIDSSTGMPTDVRDTPNSEYWGSFYWVKPRGLRSVVGGIGVADPLEAMYGTAVWWDYLDARSFFGLKIVGETPERQAKRQESLTNAYREMLRSFPEEEVRCRLTRRWAA